MNRAYKVIWNRVKKDFTVVSEKAGASQGGGSVRTRVVRSILASLCLWGIVGSLPYQVQADTLTNWMNENGLTPPPGTIYTDPSYIASAGYIFVEGSTQGGMWNIPKYSRNTVGSLAVGHWVSAGFMTATAVGNYTAANAAGSLALGIAAGVDREVQAGSWPGPSTGGIAMGAYSWVSNAPQAIAIGYNSLVQSGSTSSIAFGGQAQVGQNSPQSLAIGPAAMVQQNAQNATAMGWNATVQSGGQMGTAIGAGAIVATGASGGMALGAVSQVGATQSVAVGTGSSVSTAGSQSTVVGTQANASGDHAVGIGYQANVSGNASLAIGSGANATAEQSVAVGYGASATATNAMALGNGAQANKANSIVIGKDSRADDTAQPAIGTFLPANQSTAQGVVSMGSDTIKRRIMNVAAGTKATDAANLGQLHSATYFASNQGPIGYATSDGTPLVVGTDGKLYYASAVNPDTGLAKKSGEGVAPTDVVQYTLRIPNGAGTFTTNTLGRLQNLAEGVADTDAVNFGQLKTLEEKMKKTAKPITLQGNQGSPYTMQLGGTVTIQGAGTGQLDSYSGSNIVTQADANGVQILLSKHPVFDTVVAKDGTAKGTLTAKTVSLTDGTHTVSLGADTGLNVGGNKISNLTAGTEAGDAATYGQVKTAMDNASQAEANALQAKQEAAEAKALGTTATQTAISASEAAKQAGIAAKAAQDAAKANTTALAGTAKADGSNISNPAQWANVLGTGTVASGDTNLVTGNTVYNAVKNNADKDLSNLTSAGDGVIRRLASGAITLVDGTNTKVSRTANDNGVTYSVNVSGDLAGIQSIAATDTGAKLTMTSTGVTISDANAAQQISIVPGTGINLAGGGITNLKDGVDNTDAVNLGQLTNVRSLAEANQTALTGLTPKVEAAQKAATAANQAASAASQAATEAKNTAGSALQTAQQANTTAEQASMAANTAVQTAATATSTANTAKDTAGDAKTLAERATQTATAAQQAAGEAKQAVADTQGAMQGKANADGSNITNPSTWANTLGTGTIDPDSHELVTGSKVATAMAGKVDTNLSNLTQQGQTTIQQLAGAAVQVKAGTNAIVTADTQKGVTTYTVAMSPTLTDVQSIAGGNTLMRFQNNGVTFTDSSGGTGITIRPDQGIQMASHAITGLAESTESDAAATYGQLQATDQKAVQALQKATAAQGIAGEAKTSAQQAQVTAKGAETVAQQAQTVSNQAKDAAARAENTAGEANAQATAANTAATEAKTVAKTASDVATAANTAATQAVEDLAKVKTGLGDAKTQLQQAQQTATAAQTLANANAQALAGKAMADGANVTNPTQWASKLGTGTVTAGNMQLVTGGTVAQAMEGKANTSLDNLTQTGTNTIRDIAGAAVSVVGRDNIQVQANTDQHVKTYSVGLQPNLRGIASIAGGNGMPTMQFGANGITFQQGTGASIVISPETGINLGGKKITNLSDGEADTDAATISQLKKLVHDFNTTSSETGANIDSVGKAAKQAQDSALAAQNTADAAKTLATAADTLAKANQTALAGKADVDGSNITTPGQWAKALGTGTVEKGNANLVTGGTVAEAIAPLANRDLNNLTPAGVGTLQRYAQQAVDVVGGQNVQVTSQKNTAGTTTQYTVQVQGALTGITSISNAGTTLTITPQGMTIGTGSQEIALDPATGIQMHGGKITGLTAGDDDNDAATVGQVGAVRTLATTAGQTAQQAKQEAADAQTVAGKAQTAAQGAVTQAENATKSAQKANEAAQAAVDNAGKAVKEVAEANTKAQQAVDTATTAQQVATTAQQAAENAVNAVDKATKGLQDANTAVQKAQKTADEATAAAQTNTAAIATKAALDGSNIQNPSQWAGKLGIGHVVAGDGNLVTGATVAEAIAPLAKDDLSNLQPAGKTVIQNIANASVKVLSSDNISVTHNLTDGVMAYTPTLNSVLKGITGIQNGTSQVQLAPGGGFTVREGSASIVINPTTGIQMNQTRLTGLADGEAESDAVTYKQLQALKNSTQSANSSAEAATQQAEQAVQQATQAVAKANEASTAANNATQTAQAATEVAGTAKRTAESAVETARAAETQAAGAVATAGQAEQHASEAKQVAGNALQTAENANRVAAQAQITANEAKALAEANQTAVATKADADGANVTNAMQWATKLGTGTVDSGNKELVTGGTVYQAVRDKVNQGLDNLSAAGESKIKGLAVEAVTMANGTNTVVTVETTGDNKTYKVNVAGDLTDIHSLTNAGTTLTMDANGVTLNDKKLTGLAEGTIAAGSTDAVTGGQVAALRDTLNTVAATAAKKFTFVGNTNEGPDNASTYEVGLGQAIHIVGSEPIADATYSTRNITTVTNSQELSIRMADRPVFEGLAIKAGEGGPSLSLHHTQGMTLQDASGKAITLDTLHGLNMNDTKITGLAPGTEANDAVTLQQLQDHATRVSAGEDSMIAVTSSVRTNGGTDYALDLTQKTKDFLNQTRDTANSAKQQADIATQRADAAMTRANEAYTAAANSVSVEAGENIMVQRAPGSGTSADNKVNYVVSLAGNLQNIASVGTGNTKLSFDTSLNANSNKITNVADGAIAANSKEAVNGGQIFDLMQGVGRVDNQLNAVRGEIRDTAALTAALSGLSIMPYQAGDKAQIMASVGGYRGATAVALGAAFYRTPDEVYHGGVSYNGRDASWNVGVSWRYSGGAPTRSGSQSAMTPAVNQEVARLTQEVAELRAITQQQAAENKALLEKLEWLMAHVKV